LKFIFIIDISSDIKNNIADIKKAEVKKNVPNRKILLPIIKDLFVDFLCNSFFIL
tara:strand:+ start:1260 stop:1424 length:165 start_codon:yes stop_codon:yes gene_type:complete